MVLLSNIYQNKLLNENSCCRPPSLLPRPSTVIFVIDIYYFKAFALDLFSSLILIDINISKISYHMQYCQHPFLYFCLPETNEHWQHATVSLGLLPQFENHY